MLLLMLLLLLVAVVVGVWPYNARLGLDIASKWYRFEIAPTDS